MRIGPLCKNTSIVMFVFSFIGSIVLANELGGRDFSFPVFLTGVIVSFLSCAFLYAIGEIVTQLETLNANTAKLLEKIPSPESKKETQKSCFTAPPAPVVRTADGGWVCKKCGSRNAETAQYCKDCGQYK